MANVTAVKLVNYTYKIRKRLKKCFQDWKERAQREINRVYEENKKR
jgi:hypothetical protein